LLSIENATINSYFASVLADFIRHQLLKQKTSFTFETVMSFKDKVDFLREAKDSGYRTYLYYIATDDPEINKSRVRNRVHFGGHPVSDEKIVSRYKNSLSLLIDAVRQTNRAYNFDNSNDGENKKFLIAEITEGKELVFKADLIPAWFKHAVLDKITHPTSD
jgi:predicted ABC-type ATPase